jgi:hypothetical protein
LFKKEITKNIQNVQEVAIHLWLFNKVFEINSLEQILHLYGFSPVWRRTCMFRLLL